ncbi:unnamed protein product [Toxocara canis]|uniref:DUF281 domain-containing protein n=1 Tax=Toxocara canis TaxID=6265 RepID=A0A183UGU8_TOXCA|nr:unnamed protein product [Toxocara canis]
MIGVPVAGYSESLEREYNCSVKDGTHACYTCMGRDMVNCETGTVCCNGSCFKLVDEQHSLIMKGCTSDEEEDGSMKRKTLDVRLYWSNDERVTGETFYCKGSDYCNVGYLHVVGQLALLGVVVLAVL